MTKEKLTIELFGKTKFWIGVSLGLATTLILFFFFAYGREILRGATTDLIIPTKMEFIAYNLFFSAVSITIGFGLTAWYLFHNPISFKISRRWNQFIRTYLIVSTLILLVAILRTGNFVFHLLYRLDGYDSHLSFVNELPELLILMPTVFFLNIWTPIRLKYRAGIWFWYSIMVYACGTIALGFSSPIDQSIMNGNWEKKNAPYREIVNNEIIRARELGINVHQEEIEKLIYNRRQKAIDQAMLIKKKNLEVTKQFNNN